MVKIIDVGQTKRAPGVAKDYVTKERSMRILTIRMLSIRTGCHGTCRARLASVNAPERCPWTWI